VELTPPAAGDLGPCEAAWCFRPAVAYVSGPTLGRSPRVTVIAGERAAQLAAANTGLDTYGALRCVDCVLAAVEDCVGHVPAGPVRA
jgi:hypothetical protein